MAINGLWWLRHKDALNKTHCQNICHAGKGISSKKMCSPSVSLYKQQRCQGMSPRTIPLSLLWISVAVFRKWNQSQLNGGRHVCSSGLARVLSQLLLLHHCIMWTSYGWVGVNCTKIQCLYTDAFISLLNIIPLIRRQWSHGCYLGHA